MTPLERALALARGGQGALQVHRQRINDLNVYPVPDGDTGSNLADTVTRLTQGLEQLPPDADRPTIAHAATRAALMGARGNSGVILSQIVRGFAEALGAGEGPVDAGTVARALRAASDAAYGAIRQPVEGTMLTAIRAMAERAEAEPADATLDDLLASVLAAGDDAVARTQEMLPVLRQARRGRRRRRRAGRVRAGRGRGHAAPGAGRRRARWPRLRRPASTRSICSRRGIATARASWSRTRASTASCWSRCWNRWATRCWWSANRRS